MGGRGRGRRRGSGIGGANWSFAYGIGNVGSYGRGDLAPRAWGERGRSDGRLRSFTSIEWAHSNFDHLSIVHFR